MSTLSELRREHVATGGQLGQLIYDEVVGVVRAIVFTGRYAESCAAITGYGSWDQAVDDVVQEYVVTHLLGENHLAYVFAQARTIDSFRGMVGGRVHRCLKRMRDRSVVEVLLDRASDRLRDDPFQAYTRDPGGRPDGFQLISRAAEIELRPATGEEIEIAAKNATAVPTLRSAATERAPRVYGSEEFVRLLSVTCRSFPALLHIATLRAVLNLVLTDWVVGRPVPIGDAVTRVDEGTDVATTAIERDNAREFLGQLNTNDVELLRQMFAGYRDSEAAAHFGCSRQTINSRKARIRERMAEFAEPDDEIALLTFLEQVQFLIADRIGGIA